MGEPPGLLSDGIQGAPYEPGPLGQPGDGVGVNDGPGEPGAAAGAALEADAVAAPAGLRRRRLHFDDDGAAGGAELPAAATGPDGGAAAAEDPVGQQDRAPPA